MDSETFRSIYRAFADPGVYPDDAVDYYITSAETFLTGSLAANSQRWGNLLDNGIGLFVAHHLALDQKDVLTAQAGGVPGELKGPASAKAVDKVSASYDTRAVTFEDEAFWNQTRYGVQFINLVRMVGAGGMQLGACAPEPPESGGIWGVLL